MIRNIFTLILIGVTVLTASSQVEDSVLYRKHNIREVQSWVHITAFENSNDTCLLSTKNLNERGLPTYVKMDYNCQGWNLISEAFYTYDERFNLTGIKIVNNDQISTNTVMKPDSLGRTVYEKTEYFDPAGTIEISYVHYGDTRFPDSTITTEINGIDTTVTRAVNTYVNGKMKRSDIVDISKSKPVSSLSNKYDAQMRLIRSEYIFFQGYDRDNITKYTYNTKGQISKTESELDDLKAEFYYDDNGLPIVVYYFNKFGSLERQVWHKYQYYE